MTITKKTMGLAMLCGVAVTTAQASIDQSYTTFKDIPPDVITSPLGGSFWALSADYGTPISKEFDFTLAKDQVFHFDVGFLNDKPSGHLLDTASLTINSQPFWSIDSSHVHWASDPVTHAVTSRFSGWTAETFTAPADATYTFILTENNSSSKYTSVAFFAPVPEPSTLIAGGLVGILSLTGLVRRNRK